jgi:uncharacterized membrane protein YdjX (TVP38/TMEM64 family)
VRTLGPVVSALALVTLILPGLGGAYAIIFAKKHQPWVQAQGFNGILAFAALMGLTTGLALMPTYALSFASGVFFTFWTGFPVAMVGIIIGACIGYAWGATVARKKVMTLIDSNERARIVRGALIDRTFWRNTLTVILLRFPPNSPFALTNLVMSSTKVHPLSFILGTLIGIAPRTGLAVYLGHIAGNFDKFNEERGIGKYILIAASVALFLGVYWVLSRWAKQALDQRLGTPPKPSENAAA